jgi:hypothetical protein
MTQTWSVRRLTGVSVQPLPATPCAADAGASATTRRSFVAGRRTMRSRVPWLRGPSAASAASSAASSSPYERKRHTGAMPVVSLGFMRGAPPGAAGGPAGWPAECTAQVPARGRAFCAPRPTQMQGSRGAQVDSPFDKSGLTYAIESTKSGRVFETLCGNSAPMDTDSSPYNYVCTRLCAHDSHVVRIMRCVGLYSLLLSLRQTDRWTETRQRQPRKNQQGTDPERPVMAPAPLPERG